MRGAGAWSFLRTRYLLIDDRAAALFRIALGALLILDCLRHWREADLLYSNDGVLSNHYHLYRTSLFSFFHAFSTSAEVHLLFGIGLAIHVFFLVGYRTRVFAVLGFVWVTSRDSRMELVENGGYIVQNLACLWACFLPLQKRFSIDAWRASWRARSERSLDELNAYQTSASTSPVTRSLVGLTVIVNLAIIYLFNVVNKTGYMWREGDTIHYVLHIDRMVTGVAVFVRETFPLPVLRVVDFLVLATEATICVAILSPYARKYTRLLAIALIVLLHTTLGIFMRLGPFSWFLIGWAPLLLLPVHFGIAYRFYERRSRGCEVGIDCNDAFALAVGRAIARVDHGQRMHFVDPPAGAVIAARSSAGDEWQTSPASMFRLIAEALPFGRWWSWLLRVLTLGTVTRLAGALLAQRKRVTWFFGLTCMPAADTPDQGPMSARLVKLRTFAREALIGYLAICSTMQAWLENKVIPKSLPPPIRPGQELRSDERRALDFLKGALGDVVIPLKPDEKPSFLKLTIDYPRIFQGWGMFAPNPIKEDGVLALDALTVDGRHLDPLTGRAPDLNLSDSRGEGLSQLRQDYGNRIRLNRNEQFREGLKDYVVRLPERTGSPKDEIVSLDVYWVTDHCPPPGARAPFGNEAIPIFSWRKPHYTPAPGGPKLPPKLKVRSAEGQEDVASGSPEKKPGDAPK